MYIYIRSQRIPAHPQSHHRAIFPFFDPKKQHHTIIYPIQTVSQSARQPASQWRQWTTEKSRTKNCKIYTFCDALCCCCCGGGVSSMNCRVHIYCALWFNTFVEIRLGYDRNVRAVNTYYVEEFERWRYKCFLSVWSTLCPRSLTLSLFLFLTRTRWQFSQTPNQKYCAICTNLNVFSRKKKNRMTVSCVICRFSSSVVKKTFKRLRRNEEIICWRMSHEQTQWNRKRIEEEKCVDRNSWIYYSL